MKNTTFVLFATLFAGACSSPPTEENSAAGVPSAVASPAALVPARVADAEKTAADVLLRVRDVVATGRASKIGFTSPEELEGATIGAAIPVYYVSGAQVLERTAGSDPHALLGKPMEMLYPILVNGVVRSEVMMGHDDSGKWFVTGVGKPETIRAIDQARQTLAAGGQVASVALVEMHDLGVSLLAHEETGDMAFTAYSARTSAGLALGERVPAETALTRLAELARRQRVVR